MESITQRDRWVNRSPVHTGIAQREVRPNSSAELHAANQQLVARRQAHNTVRPAQSSTGWLTVLQTLPAGSIKQKDAEPASPPPPRLAETVLVSPTMAVSFHQYDCVAEARLWLLCRSLDSAGCGWLDADTLRNTFANKQSATRIAGWRRLRQLLQRGKSRFWTRDDNGRIWLRSAEKVALSLGITRLEGRPVLLPTACLTDSLKTAKAHLYATFHSGRTHSAPISRQTLSKVTSVPERTQRTYETTISQPKQHNIAVGQRATKESRHEHFATRPGAFELIDKKGKQGAIGTRYQAWQLPNSYGQLHRRASKAHQKRLNRRLKSSIDLANQRAQGNDAQANYQRLFFDGQHKASSTHYTERYHRDSILGLWFCVGH